MDVQVGPLEVMLHAGDRVLVSDRNATISPDRKQGFFCADTRLASRFDIAASGTAPVLLDAVATASNVARHEFCNAEMLTPRGRVREHTVHFRLDRCLTDGVDEQYTVTCYEDPVVEFVMTISVASDFADIFDVKALRWERRGQLHTSWDGDTNTLRSEYQNGDFRRAFELCVDASDSRPSFANGSIEFHLCLQRGEPWHASISWMPRFDGPSDQNLRTEPTRSTAGLAKRNDTWPSFARVSSGQPAINAVIGQAFDDLRGLRLWRSADAEGEVDDDGWVPAGGIPWFLTVFGRDALVVGLQTLPFVPSLCSGALTAHRRRQGTRYDDAHDEQPGRIAHEVRNGELAYLGRIPQTPYYGTHDATSLFVWAAGELWRWRRDADVVRRLRPHVERALHWIDHDGDSDGDGLQEYETHAGDWGFYNLSWKDAEHSIIGADGSQAQLPIATCELQGYVVAAKRSWANALEESLDDTRGAARLRAEADRLAGLIEERLWWAEESTYYLGLDGRKRPIASVASNAGHLLWAEAIDPDRARTVMQRLCADDMASGWGVRTLSAEHPAFNPFSYQRGSVWPHDNAIIVDGALRYGLDDAAAHIARGLFDAALRFHHRRVPEVFSGLARDGEAFPVQYLGANVPQAWASGAIVHLVAAFAAIKPTSASSVRVRPRVPDWMAPLDISGLRLGDASLDIRLGNGTVLDAAGDVTVEVDDRTAREARAR